uniref:Uncharacterized protein n=1 Tax=Juglanconis sp. TaxID=2041886 RepID=A0A291LII3_9PEZI|nr:hypothetical protein [Juglanconis sp.]
MWDSAQFHANSYTVSLIRAFFGMIKWTIVKYSGLKRGGYLSIVDKLTLLFYSSGLPLSSYLSFLGSGSGIYSIIRKCRMCRQFTQMGVYKCGSFIRTPPLTLLNHKKYFSTSCVRRNSDLAASSLKLSKCSSKLAITFLILESSLNICLGFLVVFYRLRGSKKSLFHT